jgi:hypothetical protein
MFLVYIDDSGDEHTRCFSALIIHESVWKLTQFAIKDYRRRLKVSDGIFVTKELHATEFIAGRGRIGSAVVTKGRRSEIFRETLSMIASLPKIKMINAFTTRANERVVFERMINRINRAMAEWKSNAIIFHDEGKDYTHLIRRMGIYNPIQSKYGNWPNGNPIRNMPIDRIIEDIVYRDSKQSPFIQLADFCAYALFRSEVPLASKAKYGLEKAFKELEPICLKPAFAADPRKLGIIRYP